MPEPNKARWFGVRPTNPEEPLPVRDTHAMLAGSASVSVAAGSTATIDIKVPTGECWEIRYTNHISSGTNITLNMLYISPDSGTTFYSFRTSHLDNHPIVITAGNVLRAEFKNVGTVTETAVLNYFGRKLKWM